MEKLGSCLNVVESFPIVGFRFNPTDKVSITRYLKNKAEGKALPKSPINDADVHGVDPCQLLASHGSYTENENEDATAYFFTQRQQHSNSEVTRNGFGMWKPTSSPDQEIVDDGTGMVIGLKRRLECSIPDSSSTKETYTKLIMKEYSLPTKRTKEEVKEGENQKEWVLCKIKWEKKEHPQFDEAAPTEEDYVVTVGEFPGEDGALNEGKTGALREGIEKQEEFQALKKENEIRQRQTSALASLHKHVRASHVDVKMDEC